jgi:hypothetical protein
MCLASPQLLHYLDSYLAFVAALRRAEDACRAAVRWAGARPEVAGDGEAGDGGPPRTRLVAELASANAGLRSAWLSLSEAWRDVPEAERVGLMPPPGEHVLAPGPAAGDAR